MKVRGCTHWTNGLALLAYVALLAACAWGVVEIIVRTSCCDTNDWVLRVTLIVLLIIGSVDFIVILFHIWRWAVSSNRLEIAIERQQQQQTNFEHVHSPSFMRLLGEYLNSTTKNLTK